MLLGLAKTSPDCDADFGRGKRSLTVFRDGMYSPTSRHFLVYAYILLHARSVYLLKAGFA